MRHCVFRCSLAILRKQDLGCEPGKTLETTLDYYYYYFSSPDVSSTRIGPRNKEAIRKHDLKKDYIIWAIIWKKGPLYAN